MRSRKNPFRVLLVDDTLRLADHASALYESGELVPSGPGCDARSVLDALHRQQPDVLVVDLTGEASFVAIERVMADAPKPILVLKAKRREQVDPFLALNLGALEIAERAEDPTPDFWRDLAKKLTLLAQVRVVRHVQGRRRRPPINGPLEPPFPLVSIASSLGGPKALSHLLRMVPKDFAAPICVCQHISDGFTGGLAQWLSNETELRVTEARDGDRLERGTVFIAPSGAHLMVRVDGRLRLDHGPPLMGFKPSCNALLFSAAEAFGRRAIGVVLTGMGKDGARGLMEIRSRGGRTIAQDEASCVVFGMPREAVELGAAEQVLPLEEIAPALIRLVESC